MPIYENPVPRVKDLKGIHIYTNVISQNCLRVGILLEEKGVSFEEHKINLIKGEQFEKEYLEINPQGLIPAMVYDGVAVADSKDVMKYLEKFGPGPSFTPTDEAAKNEVHKWVDLSADMHIGVLKELFYVKEMGRPATPAHLKVIKDVNKDLDAFYRKYGNGFSESEKAKVLNDVSDFLSNLEKELTKNTYVGSSAYTIADMAIYAVLSFIKLNKVSLSAYPNIRKWYKKISRRPAVKAANKKALLHLPRPIIRLMFKISRKKTLKKIRNGSSK